MGLSVKMPPDFLEKMHVIGGHLKEIQWPTFAIGIGTLALIRLWPTKINRFFPGSFAALIVFTLIALLWAKFGSVEFVTIGSKFGGIPSRLPSPHLPEIDWSQFKALLTPAFKIAMLAAIESLLCAVVSDGMIGDRHYSNTELVAQGIANIGSGLMGGIPATAAIARTATNVRSGGATPIAGIVHALVLLLIIMVAAPLASSVPLAVLGGVLFNTAINMGEWHTFRRLTRWPRSDATIFIVTFLLTVIFDLVVAVEFGMVLAAISLIKRISETTAVSDTAIQPIDDSPAPITDDVVLPPGVMAYRIIGTFFFGAADMLETALRRAGMLPKVLIIRLSRVNALDVSGINALEDLQEKLKRHGGQMVLSGPHSQPLEALQKAGFIESIGSRNVCSNFKEAVARSAELVAS
jgi:SulP family sulfate permease